jgi:hypothetical protein
MVEHDSFASFVLQLASKRQTDIKILERFRLLPAVFEYRRDPVERDSQIRPITCLMKDVGDLQK